MDPLTKLAEIIDRLYVNGKADWQIAMGIWDETAKPFTYYAIIKDEQNITQYGEDSYGAETLEKAIDELYNDFMTTPQIF